jgi:hypothetical protein
MIRSGHFGWEDYFAPIMDAITTGGDYYLVANDFIPYIEMQVGPWGFTVGKSGNRQVNNEAAQKKFTCLGNNSLQGPAVITAGAQRCRGW